MRRGTPRRDRPVDHGGPARSGADQCPGVPFCENHSGCIDVGCGLLHAGQAVPFPAAREEGRYNCWVKTKTRIAGIPYGRRNVGYSRRARYGASGTGRRAVFSRGSASRHFRASPNRRCADSFCWTARRRSETLPHCRATGWKRCGATAPVSTAFGSTRDGASASGGRTKGPAM